MLDAMLELTLSQVAIASNLRPNTVKTYRARLVAIGAQSDWDLETATEALLSVSNPNTRASTAIAIRKVLELQVPLQPVVAHDWALASPADTIKALKNTKYETRALIMAVTSCRLSEACAITKSDLSGNQLVTSGQIIDGVRVAPKTKAHVKTVPSWLAAKIAQIDGYDSPNAVRSELARLSKKTGLCLNASALRSFAANYLLANDVNLYDVSKQLGHSNISTTSTFYLQANRQKVASVLDNLNPALVA